MSISDNDLVSTAKDARDNAYCRYSGFSVGAAIIDDNGRLHVGCNVENASYPLGNCAEAAAIAAMVQEGGKCIDRIAVAGGASEISGPACSHQRLLTGKIGGFSNQNSRADYDSNRYPFRQPSRTG